MVDKYRVKVVRDAIRRLREAANLRHIKDERGRVTHEGAPTPGHIEHELNTIYRLARKRAKKDASDAE